MRNRLILAAALALSLAAGSAHSQGLTRVVPGPTRSVQTAGATSATVGAFTVAAPDGADVRQGCMVVNTSAVTLYAFLKQRGGASATVAASIPIAAGATWPCPAGNQDELDLSASAASAAYVLLLW